MNGIEIKFRAWDGSEMIYKSICDSYDDYYLMSLNGDFYPHTRTGDEYFSYEDDDINQKEYTLMQYVGLKDKNGKEAYVGNIYKEEMNDGTIRYYKIFEVKGGFAINQFQDDFKKEPSKIQFYAGLSDIQTASFFEGNLIEIGNIYEHPELLK